MTEPPQPGRGPSSIKGVPLLRNRAVVPARVPMGPRQRSARSRATALQQPQPPSSHRSIDSPCLVGQDVIGPRARSARSGERHPDPLQRLLELRAVTVVVGGQDGSERPAAACGGKGGEYEASREGRCPAR
ncbi:hypothetical protein SNE510_06550 [Streptomyces sp. NE5-10]|nr:hypothetical protein SNE510_06550 [Streptomyces sp. NE5-10]